MLARNLPTHRLVNATLEPGDFGFPVRRSRDYSALVREDYHMVHAADSIRRMFTPTRLDAGVFFMASEDEAWRWPVIVSVSHVTRALWKPRWKHTHFLVGVGAEDDHGKATPEVRKFYSVCRALVSVSDCPGLQTAMIARTPPSLSFVCMCQTLTAGKPGVHQVTAPGSAVAPRWKGGLGQPGPEPKLSAFTFWARMSCGPCVHHHHVTWLQVN